MRIAHLADIHIQDRRRDEYSNVLAKLYSSLREEKPDIIAVVGDVFDSKTKATANNFADVAKFLSALTEIAPVVLCPGNHDTNLSTPGALDLLTPVVAEHRGLQPPGLTYWRNTGVYAAHGIIWAVVAPDGPKPSSVEVDRARQRFEADGAVAPGAMQLCLFHEEVDGAALPNGMLLRDSRLTPKDFAPYDAALGGHIHQRQMITPRAGYCSSLVQQNIGESHVEHGYVLWEFTLDPLAAPYRTPIPVLRGVNIPNERGYLRVRLSGGQDVTQEPRPARPYYYEVMHDETTSDSQVEETAAALTAALGFKPRAIRRKADQLGTAQDGDKEQKLPDGLIKAQESARSVEMHEAIIREILHDSPVLEQVVGLHREKYTELVPRNTSRARIRLLRLDFDNLYCYGPGNSVDFTRIERCLSGIVAQNYMGKSSLIDIIVFALYDEVPRADMKKCIVNSAAPSYRLTLLFELDGKIGRIDKSANASGKNSTLNIYRFMYADEDLTQGDVKSTCAEIAKIVGSYEDAQLTAIAHQDGGMDFVRQAPVQRKKAVARLLALGSFEDLEKSVTKELYALNASHKTLQEQYRGTSLADLEHRRDRAAGDVEDAAEAAEAIKEELNLLEVEQRAAIARELENNARLATCSARRAGLESATPSVKTTVTLDGVQARMRTLLASAGLETETDAREELANAEYRTHTDDAAGNNTAVDGGVPTTEQAKDAWQSIQIRVAEAALHSAQVEKIRATLAAMTLRKKAISPPKEPVNPRPDSATPWPESRRGERPDDSVVGAARARAGESPSVAYNDLVLFARASIGPEPPRTEREGEYAALQLQAKEDTALRAKLADAKNARDAAAESLAAAKAGIGAASAPKEPAYPRPASAAPWPESRKGERPAGGAADAARAYVEGRPSVAHNDLVLFARAPIGPEPPRTEREGEYAALQSQAKEDTALRAKLSSAKTSRDGAAQRLVAAKAGMPSYQAKFSSMVDAGKQPAQEAHGIAECESALERAKAQYAAVESVQALKDSIDLRDGCPGCSAMKKFLSSDGLSDYRQAVDAAKTDLTESQYATVHKAIADVRNAADALRLADAEVSACLGADARAQRLQALEDERGARTLYREKREKQSVWQAHLNAAETLEAAAYWWDADAKAWASYDAAHKAMADARNAADALRLADTEVSACLGADARAQRLQALEDERGARTLYREKREQQSVWQAHLEAVETLEAAAYWWDADTKAWASYDIERATYGAYQDHVRQNSALEAELASKEQSIEEAAEANRAASAVIARRVRTLERITKVATLLRSMQANEERRLKHEQATAEEAKLKDTVQKDAKHRQDTSARLKDLQVKHDTLQKKIVSCKALEVRNETLAAEETQRVTRAAEIQARRDVLEAYRRVLKTSGGIAERLLRQARGDLESAINQTLEEAGVPFRVLLDSDFGLAVGQAVGKLPPQSSGVASGCQKFIVALASRHALWRLAEVSLLDCLIVDEGFAVCDDTHLEAVAQYLETAVALATAPRLHFVVSHLDALKNRLERPLAIERRGDVSYVANTSPLEATAKAKAPAATAKASAKAASVAAAPAAKAASVAAAPSTVLPPDPDHAGNVWCAVCAASLTAARGARHLTTDVHARAVKRAAKRVE